MREAKRRLEPLDLAEVPDVWDEALAREATPQTRVDVAPRGAQRVLTALVAVGISAAAAVLVVSAFETPPGRTDASPSVPVPETRGVWTRLPAPPIPFRHGSLGLWVDGRVVILGGYETPPPCSRFTDCRGSNSAARLDGVAYDPSAGTWTTIPPAPMPILTYSGTVLGDGLYLWGSVDGYSEASLLIFDVNDNLWQEFPIASGARGPAPLLLTSAGDMILAYSETQEHGFTPDSVFVPSTHEWRAIPRDPLIPSFDRSIVWTGSELVLIATESEPPEVASYEDRVATFDMSSWTWRRLPDSGTSGNPIWFWSAGRIVNPEIGHVGDSGSIEGTGPPYGGIFDPSTGEWSELPEAPTRLRSYGGPSAGGDRYVVTEQGAILDVESMSWELLPAPPVAPDEQSVAVWAGDRLMLWGGYRWTNGGNEAEMVRAGWSWIPSE